MAVDDVSAKLLVWYDANARVLPWRHPPGTSSPAPYRVWLSEIMLQQTTVAMAAPYYAKFLAIWPAVENLAAADDGDVMREWAGLGYYARARNLLACARAVVAGGGWPDTEAGLHALPGIGAYTAAAVAAIAFDRRAVVVDGNVERVVARLFAVAVPLPRARPELRALADRLTPATRTGDHAQAMMDLGATVCTPRLPSCEQCPVAADCAAYAGGDPARYPVKLAKAATPVRYGEVYWIEVDGEVLLERRPAKGLLGGMLGLPTGEWGVVETTPMHIPVLSFVIPAQAGTHQAQTLELMGPRLRGADDIGRLCEPITWYTLPAPVRHVFTHFELRLSVAVARPAARPNVPGEWHPVATIAAAGLPTLFARVAAAVLRARDDAALSPVLDLETPA